MITYADSVTFPKISILLHVNVFPVCIETPTRNTTSYPSNPFRTRKSIIGTWQPYQKQFIDNQTDYSFHSLIISRFCPISQAFNIHSISSDRPKEALSCVASAQWLKEFGVFFYDSQEKVVFSFTGLRTPSRDRSAAEANFMFRFIPAVSS